MPLIAGLDREDELARLPGLQEIADQFGVSRMTVYRVVKEAPEQTAQRAQQAKARAKARAEQKSG